MAEAEAPETAEADYGLSAGGKAIALHTSWRLLDGRLAAWRHRDPLYREDPGHG
jgi:hypothetical protein